MPNYNRADALPLTLKALNGQTISRDSFEVIVVDDGSSDCSADIVANRGLSLKVKLLREENRGPAAARNLGAQCAQAEILIFLDSDMIPDATLVQEHLLAHEARPGSIVMGRIRLLADANRSLFDEIARMEEARDLGPDPIPISFYHLVSCNFSVAREQFDALGGFDESLRQCEDTELGYRIRKTGLPLVYWPAATAFHNHPRTLQQRCLEIRSGAARVVRVMRKHPDIIPLLPIYQDILPIRWGVDSASLVLRKLGRRGLALTPIRRVLTLLIDLLEDRWPNPALLRSLYYKTMSGYRVEGLRAGWRSE